MYVLGLIMTSFPTERVCRLSHSLRTIQLTPSENTHSLQDHVEFYMSTTSSSSVETSFSKSFKLDHIFHFEISSTSVLPLYSGSPSQIFIFQKPSTLRTLWIQNPALYQYQQCVCELLSKTIILTLVLQIESSYSQCCSDMSRCSTAPWVTGTCRQYPLRLRRVWNHSMAEHTPFRRYIKPYSWKR